MAAIRPAYLLSLFGVTLLLTIARAQLNVPKELVAEKAGPERSGVKARLSEKGVHYVASFLTNTLVGELGKAKGLEIEPKKLTDKATLLPGELRAHNPSREVRIQLLSPKSLVLEIPSISFTVDTLLDGQLEDAALSNAKVEIQLPSGNLRVNLTLLRNAHGSPATQLAQCSLQLNSNPFFRYNSPLPTAQKTKLEDLLRTKAPEYLDSLLCAHVNYLVEDRVNQRFGILSSKVSLTSPNDDQLVEDLRATRRRTLRISKVRSARETSDNSTIFHTFDVVGGRASTLMLDYTLTAEPRASPLGIELECSSEVSLHGRGGTPFGPTPFELPNTTHEGSMLQMAVSDFVPNSLMYHGHTIGLFNTRVDPTTQHFGSIMKTSCTVESGLLFCMGDFFPTLKRLHPNLGLALSFSTTESPVIKFHPQAAGGIEFHLRGKIAMSLLPLGNTTPANITQETVVAVMGIEVAAHMRLRLSSTKVKPKVTFSLLKLTTLSPGILVQGELDDAVVLAKEVLQRMVNEVLREGIPLPVHPLFRLNKPKVKVQERTILLQTDLNLNEALMLKLMSQDL